MTFSMADYRKPLPLPDEDSKEYWEGARRHELIIKRCQECGFYIHYPRSLCPKCLSPRVRGAPVTGRGTIYSYTITYYPSAPGFDNEIPFAVALVELVEQKGLRIVSNIVDCPLEEIYIGMPVEVSFHDVSDEMTLPQFRPVSIPGGTR